MSNIINLDSDEEHGCAPLNVNITMEKDTPQTSTNEVPAEIPNASTRRRPRKSVLYIKPNTEVQFEMISNETVSAITTSTKKQQQKPIKIVQNIPDRDEACEKFLSTTEVKDLMNRIAEERVRINYLLNASDMPKMEFSLYTLFEKLQNQFEKRLFKLNLQQQNIENAKTT